MKSLSEYDYPELWADVCGNDSDGPSLRQYLEEMILGQSTLDETWETLANLFRDDMWTTAGFAAVPLLLLRDAPDPHTGSLMATWAGLILTNLPESSEIPPALHEHVAEEFRELAQRRMLETAAAANLSETSLLQFCEILLDLKGHHDLAAGVGKIFEEELHRRVAETNRRAQLEIPAPKITMSGSLTETFKSLP